MKGVDIYNLKQISAEKGDIFHCLKSSDDGYKGFGEAYFSHIHSNVVKGWKRHNKYCLNIIVPYGKIKFVIFDDRLDSRTHNKFSEIILSPDENYARLCIHPGLWMAFQGLHSEDSILLNIIPGKHSIQEVDSLDLKSINYDFD